MENPSEMLKSYLLSEVDKARLRWEEGYDKLKTEKDIAEYQRVRREFFMERLGEMWERTPLNPQVAGKIEKPEYRVEKIVLETLPGFYATGTLFLPKEEKFKPPYPGVLVVCGHSDNGKASELYQGICVLGAMNGLAMYIQDPIDQGERFQHLKEDGTSWAHPTFAHALLGAGSILLGRNTATYEIWDMFRALDFMQTRNDIDPSRLGVAGNSGGGTQSSYLMALDSRVACAAPSCYLCSLYGVLIHKSSPQDSEQNIFGQLEFGMDHADYVIMRAPAPTLMNTRTSDFFDINDAWSSFRRASRIYARFGLSEKIGIIEIEGPHGYCPSILDASVRWMLRWLAGRDELIRGTYPLPVLTDEEIKSVPNGVLALPGARTAYDINRDYAAELAVRRSQTLAEMSGSEFSELVRRTAGVRPVAEMPKPGVVEVGGPDQFVVEPEEGIYVPVRGQWTESTGSRARIIVSEDGMRGARTDAALARLSPEDGPIFAADLRGWGETWSEGAMYFNREYFGDDSSTWYLAYLMGRNYVGMRAEDLLAVARCVKDRTGKDIEVVAASAEAALVALTAAAAEPGLVSNVVLPDEPVPSWSSYVENAPCVAPFHNLVHGVLRNYDVENLVNFVECGKPVR